MRIIVRIINKILRVLYSIKRHYINLRPTIQIGKGTIIEKELLLVLDMVEQLLLEKIVILVDMGIFSHVEEILL